MNKQISILGTGWLGMPLALALQDQGYRINGSTTSQEKVTVLDGHGITPFLINTTEEKVEGDIKSFLDGSEILIINIPPGLRRNPKGNFVSKIKHVISAIETSSVTKVLFIGSTSVFADALGFPKVYSKTLPNATTNAGVQLVEVEKELSKSPHFTATILRFSGLFDARRHPATMLSKRKGIKNPFAPVNLIHRIDCIGVIQKIIDTNSWGKVFNASYPDHPQKTIYYSKICAQMKLSIPDYDTATPSKGKMIQSDAIDKELGYAFTNDLYQL